MPESHAPRLDRVTAAGPFEPRRAYATDCHPSQRFITGLLQVEHRRSDRPAAQCPRIQIKQAHFLNALELQPRRTAIIAIGFSANCRDPGVAAHFESNRSANFSLKEFLAGGFYASGEQSDPDQNQYRC